MRNKLLQIVHVGKRQLGIDDESWRVLLNQQFYQNSSKDVSIANLRKLVQLLQSKGAKIRLPQGSRSALLPIHRKLWSTWKAMADKGVIADGSSTALQAYVNRLLPDVYSWVQMSPEQASVVLEALKQWNKRTGN